MWAGAFIVRRMTDAPPPPPPDWYPDPYGRFEHRYWDGAVWTDHVSSHGTQSSDPATGQGHVPTVQRRTDKVVRDVAKAGATPAHTGGGTLFTEPVLVVNQKAKLIEVNSEYGVYDQNGNQIGAVRQVGQSALKKVVRVIGDIDQFLTHSFQVVDASGSVVLTLTRPRKFMKSRVVIGDSGGNEIGQVRQLNAIGKIRFGLEVGGSQIGTINGENWRAWNWNIQDAHGTEVARITKTWEGLAKTMFTTADNYVLQIHRPLDDPLRSMVVASALAVDTALKQDSRGFS